MKKLLSVLLTLAMVLGMVGMASAEGEVVTLKWVTVGGSMPTNYDAWLAQINPYLEEKIGVNIEMDVIGWGDWDQRRNVIVNTNEPYDIIFGNMNTYNNDVQLGAYLDITDLLDTAAPELKAMLPEGYWDACRVNGQIYGVPTYKDSSMSQYFVWDKDLLDANGIDASQATTLEALTPILTELKDKSNSAVFPLNKNGATWLMTFYDGMNAGLGTLGVRYDDAEGKVVSVLEQDDVMANLKILHEWYNAGLINADAATLPEDNKYKVCSVAQGWPSAAITTWGPNMGVNAVAYQWGETVVSNEGAGIPAADQHRLLCARPVLLWCGRRQLAVHRRYQDRCAQEQCGLAHGRLHPGNLLQRNPHRRCGLQPVGRSEGAERGRQALCAAGLLL